MLTPVDLQQKKFQTGMGYSKKDVDAFFEMVALSYTELYKSNAELTNQVKTLTDSLVHYRTTESKLQKSLMLAEKNAEESTKNANEKAKIIENDAKLKANSIVHAAREELEKIENSIDGIKQQYKDYAIAFRDLMNSHLEFLATNPINEELGLKFEDIIKESGSGDSYKPQGQKTSNAAKFTAFSGDPQMRDESTLGGMNNSSSFADSPLGGAGGSSNLTSDSSVYTKNLGGKSFVDPFNTN
ncbi:MAG: DivIVA domain-containing protein [Coprococcus sp.]